MANSKVGNLSWAAYKKQLKNGSFSDYEEEEEDSLPVVEKSLDAQRKYQEYVREVMASENQANIVNNALNQNTYQAADPKSYQGDIYNDGYQRRIANHAQDILAEDGYSRRQSNQGIEVPSNEVNTRQKQNAMAYMDMSRSRDYDIQATNLENKLADNGTLSEDERLFLTDYKYNRELNDDERAAIDKVMKAASKEYTNYQTTKYNYGIGGDIKEWGLKKLGALDETTGDYLADYQEARKELKALGWDDEKIITEIERYKEFQNAKDQQKYTSGITNIDPNWSTGQKVAKAGFNTAIGLMTAPYRGMESLMSNLGKENSPYGRSLNSKYSLDNQMSQAGYGQVKENLITDTHPYIQKAYDIGISTAESLEMAAIGGAVGSAAGASALAKGASKEAASKVARLVGNIVTLPEFGASAYDSGYRAAIERGASEKQAQLMGFASGFAEMGTEVFSLDHFWDMAKGTKVGRNLLMDWIAQAAIEGSEEAASDILNRISDYAIMSNVDGSGKTEMQMNIENYMSQGMSEKDASRAAEWDFWKGVGEDAAAGAISGALSGGVGAVSSVNNARQMGNVNNAISSKFSSIDVKGDTEFDKEQAANKERYQNNPTQYVVDHFKVESKEDAETKKVLQEIADKEKMGEKLSISDRAYIAENGQISKQLIGSLYDNANYSNVPSEYRSTSTNITENDARAKLAEAAKNGDAQMFGQVVQDMKHSNDLDLKERAEEIANEPQFMGQLQNNVDNAEVLSGAMMSSEDAYNAGLNGEQIQGLSEKNQLAYNAGQQAAVAQTEMTKQRAEAKMESLESEASKAAYQSNLKDDTNINQYNMAWDNFFSAGRTGLDFDKELNNGVNKYITEVFGKDTLRSIYDAGVMQTQSEEGKKATDALNKALNIDKVAGVFEDARTEINDDVDYEAYRALAAYTHQNIVLANASSGKFGEGVNAYFEPKSTTMYINADASTAQGLHEALGEFTEFYNSADYEVVRKSLNQVASDVLGATTYNSILKDYKNAYSRAGQSDADIEMSREMTNDMLVSMMATEKGRNKLAEALSNNTDVKTATGIVNKIKQLFKNIVNSIKSIMDNSHLNKMQRLVLENGYKELESNVDSFIKAFEKAAENARAIQVNEATEKIGISYDVATESAYPSEQFSLDTWNESDYMQNKKEAAAELAKALNVSKTKAMQYINDINSIAKLIADDRTRLDYDADENNSAVVSNAEYGASIDFSTICKKRLLYTGTLQAIQKQIGNRVITMEDYLDIRNAMLNDGLETTCGCCYVEGSRVKLGQFMKEFIKRYGKDNPSYIPTMYDVTMPDGIRQLRAKHPEVFEAREKFLNNRGVLHEGESNLFSSQGKPKDYTERTSYKGEILKMFKGKADTVEKKNRNGGLRLQSFSDFEIVNLIDCMQVITDMSRCGLAGQAYTKVYDFADALGNTGLKINLSLMGAGVDTNGDLILDEVNGMKKADAIKLRNKYSKNVGTIIVCFTDEQIKAAMASDYIDFIIPFHRSQWRKSQYDALGLPEGTRDYTMHQNDRVIKDNGRLKKAESNYMPNDYWDFTKTGRENAEHYIEMCNNDNKAPKFPFLLNKDANGKYYLPEGKAYDGYFKLLIDFKMYDNNGVGSPQMPVQPNFSMEECANMLKEYTGGHDNFPVNDKIANEFAEKIKSRSREFAVQSNIIENATEDQIENSDVNTKFSLRVDDPPKKTIKAYKVFVAFEKDPGKLYPPMVASPGGAATPVGVWLNADTGEIARDKEGNIITNTLGRMQVKQGGKGTNKSGGGTLAWRPGWHLGEYPDAKQFAVKDPITGIAKSVFPENFIFAECEIAADEDYQLDAMSYGVNEKGKYNRTQAGLPYIPKDGYYKYRTNPDPNTAPWYITGSMKVTKILDDNDIRDVCGKFGVTPLPRRGGDIDLAKYGFSRGEVTATSDLSALPKATDYSDEIKKLPGYKKGVIDFDDPNIISEFERNNQDIEHYRNKKYSLNVSDYSYDEIRDSDINHSKSPIFDDEFVLFDKDVFRQVSKRVSDGKSPYFGGVAYSYNHVILFNNLGENQSDYAIISIIDADDARVNIHEADKYSNKTIQNIVDAINESFGNDKQIYWRGGELFRNKSWHTGNDRLSSGKSAINGRRNNVRVNTNSGEGNKAYTPLDIASEFVDLAFDLDDYGYQDATDYGINAMNEIDGIAEDIAEGKIDYVVNTLEDILADDDYEEYHDKAQALLDKLNPKKFSLSVDSEGNKLTEKQKEFFKNSEAVDEDGNLLKVYHGTVREFYTFDRSFANVEGNLGKGFYFTNDYNDVDRNYANRDGADFTAKVEREAELLYENGDEYADMELDDIIEMLKNKYATAEDPITMSCYVNIENPVYIGNYNGNRNTMLLEDITMDISEEDYEDEDEYYQALDEAVGDKVENIIDHIVDNFDFFDERDIDKIRTKLYEAASEGGETFEQLKDDMDDIGVYDSEYDYAGSEIVRLIAEAEGYDGIIDNTVSKKFRNMDLTDESVHFVVFNSNQAKFTDNTSPTLSDDVRYSLDVDEIDFFSMTDEEVDKNLESVGIPAFYRKEIEYAGVFKKKASPETLRKIASDIRKEYGSTYNLNTFVDNLQKFFDYANKQDHVSYEDFTEIMNTIARPFVNSISEKANPEEYKRFVDTLKGYSSIKLTTKQISDVRHQFGNIKTFRGMMMPIANISTKQGISLDSIWSELCDKFGGVLDRDAVEGDMPGQLYDALQAFKAPVTNYGGLEEDVTRDVTMRILEEYLGGEQGRKIAERNKAYKDKLKADYDKRLKKALGGRYANVAALKRDVTKKVKDEQLKKDYKNAIRVNARKLIQWIDKPTEKNHVPAKMVSPVLDFLKALDMVEPKITEKPDGTWQGRIVIGSADGHITWSDPITGATREEVADKIKQMLKDGMGSVDQRKWSDRMQTVKDLFEKNLKQNMTDDETFDAVIGNLDGSLYDQLQDLLQRNRNEVDVNNLNSADMKILGNAIKNIMAAINKGNKANSINEEINVLGKSTVEYSKDKEIKNRWGFGEAFYKFFRIDNLNPRTIFVLLGDSGQKLYKAVREGFNVRTWDIKKAQDYMAKSSEELGIDNDKLKEWTGANAKVYDFNLSEGTAQMTMEQIMSLYETLKRNGARDRIVGGIEIDDIDRGRFKKSISQDKAFHITDNDLNVIFGVFDKEPKAKELADRMQKYLATECSKDGNEVSMKLYGYFKFEDPTYFPYSVDKKTIDTKDSTDNRDSYTGIERSGFTNALQEGANNPLVIKGIFDVFTNHVVDMASYHGYAAANKDVLRWMNYREKSKESNGFVTTVTNKDAINRICGTKSGVAYMQKFLLDLNGMEKSSYIGNFTEKLMGNYKAAAVGANLRVVLQQPTAYLRAANMISPKYLVGNAFKGFKYSKIANENNATALWKSWGYYETNIGRSMKEVVTGVTDPIDSFVEKMMVLAGKADDYTWGCLYAAVEKEQRALHRGEKLTEEEFRKFVNDRFDDMVDQTQVVDSTIHRSQYMRGKDMLNKIQTAFMAEPIKSYNMILEACLTDVNGDKSARAKKVTRAVMSWALASIATSAAAAIADAMRYKDDDDEFWEVWADNFGNNLIDNLNPFNMLPILKEVAPTIVNMITGENGYQMQSSRLDVAGLTSILDAIKVDIKAANGEGNKTGYGVVMSNLKAISQVTGIPLYNLTRDVTGFANLMGANIKTTAPKKSDKYDSIKTSIEKEKGEENIQQQVTDAVEREISIKEIRNNIKNKYKGEYYDLVTKGDVEAAEDLASKVSVGLVMTGMSDEEADAEIDSWAEEAATYKYLDSAIASGEGIAEAVTKTQGFKDDDKIIEHIMNNYGDTVEYEQSHNTSSSWKSNVEAALQAIDGTNTYDSVKEELDAKAAEKAAKQEADAEAAKLKEDFFKAVDASDGMAARKAVQEMTKAGKDAKSIKSSISNKYHTIWKETVDPIEKAKAKKNWINATTLVNNMLNVENAKDPYDSWDQWEADQK